ncbi:MAG: DUF1361 domain-containing protein [Cyanothece sp. SIO2G6]|nr:DUF1361 domain-containing protein [Cyanothece sp. SIO2G6]
MGSLLFDISTAFTNVYSGWILWNLFLAFVPLILSFLLFRRKTIAQAWLWILMGLTSFIGVVGLWPRLPRVMASQLSLIQGVMLGELSALLKLSWLVAIALILLTINFLLMRQKEPTRTWKWWIMLAVFIVFLPNAPYVLTDIIHLIRGISSGQIPTWVVALVFIPLHTIAILLGFQAYVISLLNQSAYLKQRGIPQYILPAELLVHALSAVGIYLGRFIRLNSWDLVIDPSNVVLTTLNSLTSRWPMLVIMVTFVILTVLYWIMKQVTLGLKLRIHYARSGWDALT